MLPTQNAYNEALRLRGQLKTNLYPTFLTSCIPALLFKIIIVDLNDIY